MGTNSIKRSSIFYWLGRWRLHVPIAVWKPTIGWGCILSAAIYQIARAASPLCMANWICCNWKNLIPKTSCHLTDLCYTHRWENMSYWHRRMHICSFVKLQYKVPCFICYLKKKRHNDINKISTQFIHISVQNNRQQSLTSTQVPHLCS